MTGSLKGAQHYDVTVNENEVWARFDLTKPYPAQEEAFADLFRILASARERHAPRPLVTRQRAGAMRYYLRTLDARTCGVGFDEIAKVLAKPVGTIHRYYRQGCELRDQGYRKFLPVRLQD